jgi:hypothetical protein
MKKYVDWGNLGEIIRSWRGRGLKTGWFVEIVGLGLKLRCITQFTLIFRPADGLPQNSIQLAKNRIISEILQNRDYCTVKVR